MTNLWKSLVVLGVCAGLSSCARAQTRIVEMPRVDQELSGNRGVIQGQAPQASAAQPKTRQVIMTDVELMTGKEISTGWKRSWRPVKGQVSANGRYVAPENQLVTAASQTQPAPITQATEPASQTYAQAPAMPIAPAYQPPTEWMASELPAMQPVTPVAEEAAPATTYKVQNGDTLEKIAQKMYGNPRRWPKIYKANKEMLKNNPNRLRVGQTLTIPTLAAESSESTQRASASETIK